MNTPDRPKCTAIISSNPDISGIGVITAFFFQGFLTAVIGAYAYYVSGHWDRLKAFPGRVFWHIVRTKRPYGIPQLVGELVSKNPRHESMMAEMIVVTSDMQTLSGIALMIAALSQLSTLSAYHANLVANIAWVPSQSHHMTVIYVLEPKPYIRHQGIRIAAVAVYIVLYIVFCVFTYANVERRWDLDSYCFNACADPQCVGSLAERNSVLAWILISIVLFTSGYLPMIVGFIKKFTWLKPGESKFGWSGLLRETIFNILLFHLIACTWVAYTLSGVYGYRKGNKGLLNDRDSEETWGFGQVIAMASLILVGFEFWKIIAKHSEKHIIEELNGCHCPCTCGKRIDSFSTQAAGGSSPC